MTGAIIFWEALALHGLYLALTGVFSPAAAWWLPGSDAAEYLGLARSFAETGVMTLPESATAYVHFRPPVYPMALALLQAATTPWPSLAANAFLAAATSLLTYRTILLLLDDRTVALGVSAYVAGATLPYTPVLLTDATALCFLSASVWCAVAAATGDRPSVYVPAGLAAGLCILTRTAGILAVVAGIAAILIYVRRGAGTRAVVVFLVASAILPAMWAGHVRRETGVFGTTTTGVDHILWWWTTCGLPSGGVPAEIAACDAAMTAETRSRYVGWTPAERLADERAQIVPSLRKHYGRIPAYVARTFAHGLLSSTNDWQMQFPAPRLKAYLRPLYVAHFLVAAYGVFVAWRRCGGRPTTFLLVVWGSSLAILLTAGTTCATRVLLPSAPAVGAFVVIGLRAAYQRARGGGARL